MNSARTTEPQTTVENAIVTRIYPNPSTGVFTVEISDELNLEETTIEVFDVLGKRIFETVPEMNRVMVDLEDRGMSHSVYIVHVRSNKYRHIERVIIH